jgi:hypothetical protein
MPFVRFHLSDEVSDETRDAICAATQRALVRSLGVPERDLFQIVYRHAPATSRPTPAGVTCSVSRSCTSRCS